MTTTQSPSEPVKRVLDRLEEMGKVVRWVNNQHMAQCPAHPDRNPSLAIREGEEGAILQCHAGCDTGAVLREMGMVMADLFPEKVRDSVVVPLHPSPAPSLQWVRDYIYEDAGGTPAFKVARYARISETGAPAGKSFRQFRRDGAGWTAGLNGSQPPLYRLPEVLAAIEAGDPVIVVEGEKDADSVAEMDGGRGATTSPMGAGKWRDEHSASLVGANVIIIADDDAIGHAHALAVYEALEPVAKAVQLALPRDGYKDVSEQLEAGFGLEAIRPCSPRDLGETYVGSLPIEEKVPRLRVTRASAFHAKRVRWGWEGRMPIGELTLIPGREGVGKSLFLAWLAAQLTQGTLVGEFRGEPRAVLYVASEDSWSYTIAPRMTAAGADLDLVYRLDAVEGHMVLPADCHALVDVVADLDVEVAAVMLDPIVSLVDDRLNVNQSRELRQALEPLRQAAEAGGFFVPALAHFNKTTDTDVLSKIPGARAWAEVARAAFGLAADDETGGYVGSQIKNNLGRLDLPHLSYRIESVPIDTEDGPADVGRLTWTGETDVGVEEVLGRKPERRARDTSDATDAVVAYVEEMGMPLTVAEVHEHFPIMKRDTVRKTLARAAERGALSNPLYGHYGPAGVRRT